MSLPEAFEPILAHINHMNSLGLSSWYEVIYHDGEDWQPFHPSSTFSDGERVTSWEYCRDCL